jgi:hypothetical protein
MTFDGALIENGETSFGIIVVSLHTLRSESERSAVTERGRLVWGRVPLVLMAQDDRGVPHYRGRDDLVRFLSIVRPSRIPWTRYTVPSASEVTSA